MTNPKSAANAWSKIKNKLMTADDGTVKTFPKAPKTPRGKAKLKADTEVKGEEGEATKATPKTPRKRAAKTDDNDASPKKRGRKAIKVQEEPGNSQLLHQWKRTFTDTKSVKDVEMGDSQEAAADADPEVKEEEVPEEPKQEEVGSDAEAQEEV